MRGRSVWMGGVIVLCGVMTLSAAAWAEGPSVRCYKDEQGRIHITNIPNSPEYELIYEEPKAAPPAPRVDPSTRYSDLIQKMASKYSLSPPLVQAVIKAESNFYPYCVSSAGACGLMQLMPGTARLVGVTNIFDPVQNVEGGCKYLRMQLDRFGNIHHAIAAYNAGPEAVQRYGGIPPYEETTTYVRRVLRYYQEFGGEIDKARLDQAPQVEENPIFIYRGPDGQIHLSNVPRKEEPASTDQSGGGKS